MSVPRSAPPPVAVGLAGSELDSDAENGWMTMFIRARSRSQVEGSARGAAAWLRVVAEVVGWSARTTSRVSMLGEASQRTAIDGFSSGRYSSIHSGWLSMTATIVTRMSRSSSSIPIEDR